jgi:membrane-bound ClpP family serine protease
VGSEETLEELIELISSPPLPVATWIGPAPARAFGGAGLLVLGAEVRFAAPGSEIGFLSPAVAGGVSAEGDGRLQDDVADTGDVADIEVSSMTAAPRQVVQLLDGRTVAFAGGERVLSTLVRVDGGDTIATVVRSPGWWDGFLRLASTPDAVFFLLVAGLTVAAFEFYAIGPGIAAGVAATCLFLASYGMAVLPVRWWAVALTLVSTWVLAVAYQRGSVLALDLIGLAGPRSSLPGFPAPFSPSPRQPSSSSSPCPLSPAVDSRPGRSGASTWWGGTGERSPTSLRTESSRSTVRAGVPPPTAKRVSERTIRLS